MTNTKTDKKKAIQATLLTSAVTFKTVKNSLKKTISHTDKAQAQQAIAQAKTQGYKVTSKLAKVDGIYVAKLGKTVTVQKQVHNSRIATGIDGQTYSANSAISHGNKGQILWTKHSDIDGNYIKGLCSAIVGNLLLTVQNKKDTQAKYSAYFVSITDTDTGKPMYTDFLTNNGTKAFYTNIQSAKGKVAKCIRRLTDF